MRICLLVTWPIAPDLKQRIAAGEHPRMDVLDLACRLKAEIIDSNLATQSRSVLVRIGCLFGKLLGLALLAWQRKEDFDLFYLGNEKIGILVGALFKFLKRRPHIAMLNHYLSSSQKAFLFRRLHLQNSIDAFICLNEYQATFLERELAVTPRKVFRIHYGGMVDGAFFLPRVKECDNQEYIGSPRIAVVTAPKPRRSPSKSLKKLGSVFGNVQISRQFRESQYILSVGLESRDYAALFKALRNSQIRAKVVASGIGDSRAYQKNIPDGRLHNVEMFEHISYTELRNLYAGCSFVVIPIYNVDYPAGITAIMEAMAMGKAVIATHSRGIEEFIEDSVTGFWTEPSNPIELREKMLFLWNNPKLAIEMGERARESVKSRVDLARHVEELKSILEGLKSPI